MVGAYPPAMRGLIYDLTFRKLTIGWYAQVLRRLPDGARLLDIGIGTAGALSENAPLVQDKGLKITGVDIDPDYVRRARRNIAKAGLSDRVDVLLESIYDHKGGPYDAAYFSASFMLLPDPVGALHHISELLSDDGRLFFTQTFENKRSVVVEKAKPLLKKVTTIDFGAVTYREDFERTLDEGGVGIVHAEDLKVGRSRTYRLVEGELAG